jgi:hypothetical protein
MMIVRIYRKNVFNTTPKMKTTIIVEELMVGSIGSCSMKIPLDIFCQLLCNHSNIPKKFKT